MCCPSSGIEDVQCTPCLLAEAAPFGWCSRSGFRGHAHGGVVHAAASEGVDSWASQEALVNSPTVSGAPTPEKNGVPSVMATLAGGFTSHWPSGRRTSAAGKEKQSGCDLRNFVFVDRLLHEACLSAQAWREPNVSSLCQPLARAFRWFSRGQRGESTSCGVRPLRGFSPLRSREFFLPMRPRCQRGVLKRKSVHGCLCSLKSRRFLCASPRPHHGNVEKEDRTALP